MMIQYSTKKKVRKRERVSKMLLLQGGGLNGMVCRGRYGMYGMYVGFTKKKSSCR